MREKMTLTGKKTYIAAGVMALASFAVGMDWLTQTQYQVILGLLGSMGLASLRSGVTKSGSATAQEIKQEISGKIVIGDLVPFPGVDAGPPGGTPGATGAGQ